MRNKKLVILAIMFVVGCVFGWFNKLTENWMYFSGGIYCLFCIFNSLDKQTIRKYTEKAIDKVLEK